MLMGDLASSPKLETGPAFHQGCADVSVSLWLELHSERYSKSRVGRAIGLIHEATAVTQQILHPRAL